MAGWPGQYAGGIGGAALSRQIPARGVELLQLHAGRGGLVELGLPVVLAQVGGVAIGTHVIPIL